MATWAHTATPRSRRPTSTSSPSESVRLKNFYVSPVCSPTRASLLTGRYNFRTGVVDTYLGRAMMHPDEVTLAEMLAAAGYRTGIFGKWHLGDNAPLRPIDQGFQESLVIKGGGIGQPSDPPGGSSYFDPILQHNGQAQRYQGLLQRHLRPGRDRLREQAAATARSSPTSRSTARTTRSRHPSPSWPTYKAMNLAHRAISPSSASRSRRRSRHRPIRSRGSTRWSRTSTPTSARS